MSAATEAGASDTLASDAFTSDAGAVRIDDVLTPRLTCESLRDGDHSFAGGAHARRACARCGRPLWLTNRLLDLLPCDDQETHPWFDPTPTYTAIRARHFASIPESRMWRTTEDSHALIRVLLAEFTARPVLRDIRPLALTRAARAARRSAVAAVNEFCDLRQPSEASRSMPWPRHAPAPSALSDDVHARAHALSMRTTGHVPSRMSWADRRLTFDPFWGRLEWAARGPVPLSHPWGCHGSH